MYILFFHIRSYILSNGCFLKHVQLLYWIEVHRMGFQIQAGRIKKVVPTNRLLVKFVVEYNRRLCYYYKIQLNRHRQHDFIQWFLGD